MPSVVVLIVLCIVVEFFLLFLPYVPFYTCIYSVKFG